MEGTPKQFLYHMVPKDMRPNEEGKNVLYPLNMLKEKFPDLYEVKVEKYSEPAGDDAKKNEERKSIPERLIPTLEQAAWGDALNLTAIHPDELMKALQSAGFTPQEMKFYQIDPDLLDPNQTTIYLYREDVGEKEDPKQYEQFDPSRLHEHASLPERTKEYYKQRNEEGKRPLLFVGVPHILYKGHLDVSDIEQFPVVTAVPKTETAERVSGDSMNLSKLISYEQYAAENEHPTPYVFEYEKDGKELIYFGAAHTNNPADPMFADIQKKFADVQPDSVFVEGMPHLEEIKSDPVRYAAAIERIKSLSPEECIKQFGESGLGIKLAVEAGIDFYSPEPKFSNEIAHLEAQGYTKDEIFAEYGYRQLYQYYREDPDTPVEAYLQNGIVNSVKSATQWPDFDYSVEHLEEIGKRIWGEKGNIHVGDFAHDLINPVPHEGFVTKVTGAAQESSKYRDEYMLKEIEESMKKHNKLFIIFGASHAYMQRPVLEDFFLKK